MSWMVARWLGVLIGLLGGAIIGLVIFAWRTSIPLGLIATAMAFPVSVWLVRNFPFRVVGRRTSIWLDGPVLPGEYAVRFVCGFVVGCVFAFVYAVRSCDTLPALVGVISGVGIICGVLAMVLGDRFWTRY